VGTHLLYETLKELRDLDLHVTNCLMSDIEPDNEIILLLTRIAQEKLEYFSKKYGFKVDDQEPFMTEDFPRLMREKLEWETVHKHSNMSPEDLKKD